MVAFARAFVQIEPDMRTFPAEAKKGIAKSGLDKEGKKQGQAFGQQFTAGAKGAFQAADVFAGFGDSATVASSKASIFKRALAGINLATGVLEPALAGVLVAAGGLATAFGAAAAGAAAYRVALQPLLTQTQTVTQAQKTLDTARQTAEANYVAALKSGTSVKQAAQAKQQALTVATQKYNQTVKDIPPDVRAFGKSVVDTNDQFTVWADNLSKPVLEPLKLGLGFVNRVLTAITPLVRASAGAFSQLVGELGVKIQAGGLERIVDMVLPHVKPTILDLGHAVENLAAGLGGVFKAFLPLSGQMTGGVVKLTALFKKWGQSLPSHSGFQALMNTFKETTPLVIPLLQNLVVILKNVAAATVGLASPANSKALLNILTPLTQIIAKLSENQALVRTVLYFILIRKSLVQLGAAFTVIKTGAEFMSAANLIAKAWRIQMFLVRAQIIATAIATRAWTAAQLLLNIALDANPIGLVVIAVAALIAAVVLLWKHSAGFRNFWIGAWHVILAIVRTVWDWIKHNWPLLLAILTGPIGLAVKFILDHWRQISAGAQALINFIKNLWQGAFRTIRGWFAAFVDKILGFFGTIVHGAADAFGWIPGLGGKLRTAASAFDRFRSNVNAALRGINDKVVSVNAKFAFNAGLPAGTAGARAMGGLITGGSPGRDSVLGMLMPGEVVVPTNLVKAGAVDHLRGQLPGFAAGGVIPRAKVPPADAIERRVERGVLRALQQAMRSGALFGNLPGGPGGALGGGVGRWAPLVLQVLAMLGQSPSWLGTVLRRMNQESGGNPTIVNLWDSNAAAGTPSVGLMQVIGPTFAAYANGFRGVGPFRYGVSVNPFANIFAGLNYALHRYGTLAALAQPGGYARGGVITEPIVGVGRSGRAYSFGEKGEETVVPGRLSWGGIEARLDALIEIMSANAGETAAGVGAVLNGVTQSAASAARFAVG